MAPEPSESVHPEFVLAEVGQPFDLGGGRPRCCDQDFGGSHYHCGGGCGAVTSMYGHYIQVHGDEPEWMVTRRNLPVGFRDHWCKVVLALTSFTHGTTVHFGGDA